MDGTQSSRVFNSSFGGILTLNNLTVQNGAHSEGGGIYNETELTLRNVTLTNNQGMAAGSYGGGIWNIGNLTIQNSTLSHNQAANGGGIYNEGTATIENVTFDTNTAGSGSGVGGGIYNFGILFLEKSTLSGSQAGTGGGLFNNGQMYLTNVTLSGNSVTGSGGGIYNGTGGGIPEAHLTNVTISNNSAPNGSGGGIYNITGNTLNFKNTLVAGNSEGNCAGTITSGTITSNGHNLDSGTTCGLNTPPDLSNTNPQLSALQYHGGPTLTQALLPGSPAIDQGNLPDCPATDQRGYPRPLACDIGAYEVNSGDLVPAITTLIPNTALLGGLGFTLTVNGYNFVNGASVVQWNGANRPTTFVNTSHLTAAIPGTDLAAIGTASVTVSNSPPATFTIAGANPVPVITSLNPGTRSAGWPSFTLTVNGNNFLSDSLSVILWNGFARPTDFLNTSQLSARIPATDLAAIGTASITVSNSPPGGGISDPPVTFTIVPPLLYLPLILRN